MDIVLPILDATIRIAAPLIFVALAGLFTERAGVTDVGLEGKMLVGAFAAAVAAALSGSAWIGVLAGMTCGMLMSLIHGFASITVRGNQIISGVAINFMASGATVLLGNAWFRQGGRTPSLTGDQRFSAITLPGAEAVGRIPIVGPLYRDVVSGHTILVYLAVLAVPLAWWVLYRTRFGLRLRAVGESPGAVDTAGISVSWLRYRAVICCGLLAGLGGAYLTLATQSPFFTREMTAGRGYIALAALIFAKWKPVPVLFACLLFAFLEAAGSRMQGQRFPVIGEVPVQLIQALPYILTVILLAGFIGRALPPKAIGVPYVKER
jgi:simple sugar transport system permease protein